MNKMCYLETNEFKKMFIKIFSIIDRKMFLKGPYYGLLNLLLPEK